METEEKTKNQQLSFINKIMTKNLTEEDIPEDVYKRYMRSILGNIPFEYTFSLFDDSIKVTFVEVPFEEADKYQKVSNRLNTVGDIQSLSKLALMVYTKELVVGEKRYKGSCTIREELLDEHTDVDVLSQEISADYIKCFGGVNETIHRILPQLWLSFNTLLNYLINKGMPTSF